MPRPASASIVGTRRVLHALVVGLALSGGLGCPGKEALLLCGQIPEGGCPIGRGGTCDDALCAGLYDCVEGSWTLVVSCPGQGGSGGGGGDGGAGAGGAPCTLVELSHEGETTGCTPDLQVPDCPVAAAENCAESVCLTDCLDFFLCTAEGWTVVAFCDEEGQLVTRR